MNPIPTAGRPQFEYVDRSACVCGEPLSSSSSTIRTASPWGTVSHARCSQCGSWCQNPQVSQASLAQWYDSDEYQGSAIRRGETYANYLADEDDRIAEGRARVRRDLAPFLTDRSASVLEIGCATGSMLSGLRDAGHRVIGVDISPRFAEAANRLHGLDVRVGNFRDIVLDEAPFDLILLLGTVSNLLDLPNSLARIRELLRSDGVLVLNLPFADSVVARSYGDRFWMFAPSASTFMSRAGLHAALKRAGFAITVERTDWQQPSMRKLLKHLGAGWLIPALERVGAGWLALPFSLPIPGVELVCATPTGQASV